MELQLDMAKGIEASVSSNVRRNSQNFILLILQILRMQQINFMLQPKKTVLNLLKNQAFGRIMAHIIMQPTYSIRMVRMSKRFSEDIEYLP
tara:strand:- start:260 stop:532 length:273 start_codon:yes stop_codon:yes gene_type:complete